MWLFKNKKTPVDKNDNSHKKKITEVKESNSDISLFYAGAAQMNAELGHQESSFNAKWISVDDEMPKEEGFYFIRTNEGLAKGIASYFMDEDTGKIAFDVYWATSGKEPKVLYWLKSCF